MVNTALQWLPQLGDIRGIGIKSPVSGDILPLKAHPDFLYHSMLLDQALCIKLHQGVIKAPFKAKLTAYLHGNRRIRFTHKSGISVQLDLPLALFTQHAKAIRRLSISAIDVDAGQEIIQIEQHWFNSQQPLYCVLMILPHPIIKALFCCERRVLAAHNAAVIVQTYSK
ncbi:PTS glucose transporter subunit IIA [Rheinheimera sp. MMS21-TC3]|uniref:PTS glucose transporter subunit IIA n=1 Tax=Rheinheimera sp. MMS21-TC3 TaxID=3072790 RepID=UPI0028C40E59|nr:PTS glucose transporter subunit IIA [Rheinheimera sp. MMS21-TC3]WNO60820.1 PTS glucose transporter subunit IIA [Rheinheimera sp. MMS21-TC3]